MDADREEEALVLTALYCIVRKKRFHRQERRVWVRSTLSPYLERRGYYCTATPAIKPAERLAITLRFSLLEIHKYLCHLIFVLVQRQGKRLTSSISFSSITYAASTTRVLCILILALLSVFQG